MAMLQSQEFERVRPLKPARRRQHHRGHTMGKKRSKNETIPPPLSTTNDHNGATHGTEDYEIAYNETTISLKTYTNTSESNHTKKAVERPNSAHLNASNTFVSSNNTSENNSNTINNLISFYNDNDVTRSAIFHQSDTKRKKRAKHRRRRNKNDNDAHVRSKTNINDYAQDIQHIIDNDSNEIHEAPFNIKHIRRRNGAIDDNHIRSKTSMTDIANELENIIIEETNEKKLEMTASKRRPRRKIKRPLSATFRNTGRLFFGRNKSSEDNKNNRSTPDTNKKDIRKELKKRSEKRPKRKQKRPLSATFTKTEDNTNSFFTDDNQGINDEQIHGARRRPPPAPFRSVATSPIALPNIDTQTSFVIRTSVYGYIQSLPTSPSTHGWIYNAEYGMVIFTYNEALETTRSTRRYTTRGHLELPSTIKNDESKDDESKDDNDTLSAIDRLFVYQPVEFEIEKNATEDIDGPICAIHDENNRSIIRHNVHNVNKRKRSSKSKKNIFNDSDELRYKKGNGFISNRRNRKIQQNLQTKRKYVDIQVPLPSTRDRSGGAALHIPRPKHIKTSSVPNLANYVPKSVLMSPPPLRGMHSENDIKVDIKMPVILISQSKSVDANAPESDMSVISQKKRYKRPKGLVLDYDANEERIIKTAKVNRLKRKEKALSDTLNRERLIKLNQERMNRKLKHHKSSADKKVIERVETLTLPASVSSSKTKKRQKTAVNVRTRNVVPDDNLSLYCFTPKCRHYTKVSLNCNENGGETPSTPTTPTTPTKLTIIKSAPRAIRSKARRKVKRKKKSSFDLRNLVSKKNSSASFDGWMDCNSTTQFCPSSSQYYVRDSCLLHWEGKSIEDINQDGGKRLDTNKLEHDYKENDIFFSMTDDVEGICYELEEKINRLFNNDGGTIYVGVKETKTEIKKEKSASNSFSLTKNRSFKHLRGLSGGTSGGRRNKRGKGEVPWWIRNRIICGIEVNSQMRFEIQGTVIDDLKGFTPQVPQLLNNFFLKFIPVLSTTGKIVPSCFVIKVSVFAPILSENGEKLQFRTKDGYSHVIDF